MAPVAANVSTAHWPVCPETMLMPVVFSMATKVLPAAASPRSSPGLGAEAITVPFVDLEIKGGDT